MSDNLISRSALIETINKISFYSVHNGEFIEGAGLKDVAYYRERDIYRAIIDAPTVFTQEDIDNVLELAYISGQQHPERPKGKWLPKGHWHIDPQCIEYTCSVCGRRIMREERLNVIEQYPFCHCGADMRGDK